VFDGVPIVAGKHLISASALTSINSLNANTDAASR
jgi:hypothetical protein